MRTPTNPTGGAFGYPCVCGVVSVTVRVCACSNGGVTSEAIRFAANVRNAPRMLYICGMRLRPSCRYTTGMLISEMNWMQVEARLREDDRCVLPLGCTEQHAYLSLSVDSILAERLAKEAAEPLGVPVFPVLPYGITPYFMSYPGTISLRVSTYLSVISDILDGLAHHGFHKILIVNGHGGNSPAGAFAEEWMNGHPGVAIKFHNWWNAPKAWAKVQEIDPVASHASWMENFPWTRLAGVEMPTTAKSPLPNKRKVNAAEMRAQLGDGNFAGLYQRPDADTAALWRAGVEETRALLEDWTVG